MEAAQDIEITEKHLSGDIILLKFVKFQNVTNMQFFFKVYRKSHQIRQDLGKPSLKKNKKKMTFVILGGGGGSKIFKMSSF